MIYELLIAVTTAGCQCPAHGSLYHSMTRVVPLVVVNGERDDELTAKLALELTDRGVRLDEADEPFSARNGYLVITFGDDDEIVTASLLRSARVGGPPYPFVVAAMWSRSIVSKNRPRAVTRLGRAWLKHYLEHADRPEL